MTDWSLLMQLMFNHLKTVLKGALVVWPNAPVKLLYIEKLIVPKMQQNPDNPPPSVTVAVEVIFSSSCSLLEGTRRMVYEA